MEKHYKNDCQIETYKKLYEISKQDSFEKVNMINKGETPTYYDVSLSDKENLMTKSLNKISTKNSGKKDVMAAAREMEKMREQEESQKPRPPNMPKI